MRHICVSFVTTYLTKRMIRATSAPIRSGNAGSFLLRPLLQFSISFIVANYVSRVAAAFDVLDLLHEADKEFSEKGACVHLPESLPTCLRTA